MRQYCKCLTQAFQEAIRIQCCLAAAGGRRHRLAIDVVLHITGRKYTRYAGGCGIAIAAAFGDDVTGLVHLQLAFEDIGVGLMANRDKDAIDGDVFGGFAAKLFQPCAGYP